MVIDTNALEKIVQEVVSRYMATDTRGNGIEKQVDPESGVMAIKAGKVKPDPFDTGKEGDNVLLKDIVTLQESPRLGCGVMEMTATTFDWTLNYDEVDVVMEGSLSVIVNGCTVTAEKGEVIFIPKNTKIQFSVPEHARFIYVTYPANWEAQ